jgi:N-carbamoyl-L-amino-acid hydrolase
MPEQKNPGIDGKLLWHSLMEMAKIGATEKGGNCRLALTDLDRDGRNLFVQWCRDAGCSIKVDKMGNIFARRDGRNNALPPVVTGSHLDTQPTGGRFDGVYGVLAGLEVIRSLNDLEYVTEHPLEVAVWTNEEGSRFAPAMVASGVFAGAFDLEYGLSRADADGKTIGEELERIGYAGTEAVGGRDIHAFFEVHIEQGPILENEGQTIGVVTDAQGLRWFDLSVSGVESHAGPTPMAGRKDAMAGATRMADVVYQVAHDNAPSGCATIGSMSVFPNSRNVIPGRVDMAIDIRHPDLETLDKMEASMRAGIDKVASEIGLTTKLDRIFSYAPIHFDEGCVATVRNAAEFCGFSKRDIVSGAGHDSCYISRVAPTSMIFVPCIDGISHNEIEDAKPEWISAGGNVLFHAILEKAGHLS